MKETGKQRASRIPLDYFKSPDFYARRKNTLTLFAFTITLVCVGWGFLGRGTGEMQFSRGPVAHVHAMWDAQCTVCHAPFEPITANNWLSSTTGSQRCTTCHAGPPHHTSATPDLSCAACHREHQGRDASLVRLPDQDCTRCHTDLKQHSKGNTEFANVLSFSKSGHPPFRLPAKTDRGLKFSHERHMRPGMTLTGDNGSTGFRLKDIADPAERKRYAQGEANLDAPVKLDCSSCHKLEASDFNAGSHNPMLRPKGGTGDYMVPITFDNQCKACHPLTLSLPTDKKTTKLNVPHGLQPQEVRQFVWGAVAAHEVRKLLDDWVPPGSRPLPGKEFSTVEKKAQTKIDDLVRTRVENFLYREAVTDAEKLLFLGEHTCGRCHSVTGDGDHRRIAPTQVPNVWFKHAKFNHAKHRALDCIACHDKATTAGRDGLVLIPQIDNCLTCHAVDAAAGARSDCTECHLYHHREGPRMGLGAAARDPVKRTNVLEDFIRGKK